MDNKLKRNLKDLVMCIVGAFVLGIGTYNFATLAKFPLGGVTGISLIFYHLFHLPIGAVSVFINIPIAIVCYRILGKRFMIRSLITLVICSFFVDYVAPLFPMYEGDKFLAAICVSVLSGIGYALIYSMETSTGGMDFVIMSIRKYKPHLSFGAITFAVESTVVLLGTVLVSKSIENFIYGILINYIMSAVLDKVIQGMDSSKTLLIVTKHAQEVAEIITEVSDRGCTFMKAEGGYSNSKTDVVLCACTNREMVAIKKRVREHDPDSFTIIMDSTEVVGEGFKLVG